MSQSMAEKGIGQWGRPSGMGWDGMEGVLMS